MKNEIPQHSADGSRKQSTMSYEAAFIPVETLRDDTYIVIPLKRFVGTYRGMRTILSPPLDTSRLKRFSIMMRRYAYFSFGK